MMRQLKVNPGACGILGAISIDGSTFSGKDILDSISSINYRGSDLGAGFAYFDSTDNARIEGFAMDESVTEDVYNVLGSEFTLGSQNMLRFTDTFGKKALWSSEIIGHPDPMDLERMTDRINSLFPVDNNNRFRVVSSGNGLHVRKGVGFPGDIFNHYPEIASTRSHIWIAHTRQPTNSPGSLPIFSHPFSSFNVAVVHNGDLSSFGANVQALVNHGMRSFSGTDSEAVSKLFALLIHEYGVSVEEAVSILSGKSSEDGRFNGFALDGPYSIAAAVRHGGMDYLIAMVDRSKLRPILIGVSNTAVVVASERNEIKALGDDFHITQLRAGQFVIASSDGRIHYG